MAKCKTRGCAREAERTGRCFPCVVGTNDTASRDRFKVDVPEGQEGLWRVTKLVVSKDDSEAERMRALYNAGSFGRYTPPGEYTGLYWSGSLIMSDTPDEIRDHRSFIHSASGTVLIAGLGLGMVTRAVLGKPEVTHVTVVEKAPEVVKLVAPIFAESSRVTIICASIFDWKPAKGQRFDWAWFDIWNDLCTDNLDEMATLNRRFARVATNKGHWGRELLLARRRQERNNAWWSA